MAGFILARRRGGAATGLVGAEECVDRGGRAQADAGAVWIRYYRLGATYERPTIWELTDFVHSTALLAGNPSQLPRWGLNRPICAYFWRELSSLASTRILTRRRARRPSRRRGESAIRTLATRRSGTPARGKNTARRNGHQCDPSGSGTVRPLHEDELLPESGQPPRPRRWQGHISPAGSSTSERMCRNNGPVVETYRP